MRMFMISSFCSFNHIFATLGILWAKKPVFSGGTSLHYEKGYDFIPGENQIQKKIFLLFTQNDRLAIDACNTGLT